MKKTILITGGTSGIGLACAQYLLNAGYTVLITGRSEEKLTQANALLNGQAHIYLADCASLPAIKQLASDIRESHPVLDGVFINAGIFKPAPVADTTEVLFDETMNINFKGAFFTIQALLPLLNNPASIVVNTSLVVNKAFANTAIYTASKAALDGLVKVLNVELAEQGIRTNVIAPGVTETPIQSKAGMSSTDIHALFENISQNSPLGRVIQTRDIAPAVEFLLSDRSLAMRGERIAINGGTAL